MQIKTNNEILPHTRMALSKKKKQTKKKKQEITSWQECIEKENPKHCWWENKLEQPLWKQ